MGMFDHLNCLMPLPEPRPPEGTIFQTKDLSQQMENFTITEDGRLIHHSVRYEDVPREERPFPDAEPGTLQSLCGIIRSIPTGDVELPEHGDIHFYHYESNPREWWEYVARFTEGRCVRITLVEHEGPSVSGRHPKGEDAQSAAEGEACQSGGEAATPESPSGAQIPTPEGGE